MTATLPPIPGWTAEDLDEEALQRESDRYRAWVRKQQVRAEDKPGQKTAAQTRTEDQPVDAVAFLQRARLERAWLAREDPAGELEAIRPMPLWRAEAILEAERERRRRERTTVRIAIRGRTARDDARLVGRLLSRTAEITGKNVDANARKGMACCPAHTDEHPSLSWKLTDGGRLLARCWSRGCAFVDIVAALR
jgi:hypothetical protein